MRRWGKTCTIALVFGLTGPLIGTLGIFSIGATWEWISGSDSYNDIHTTILALLLSYLAWGIPALLTGALSAKLRINRWRSHLITGLIGALLSVIPSIIVGLCFDRPDAMLSIAAYACPVGMFTGMVLSWLTRNHK